MEKKYIKGPFDVEMAKKISNGEVDGKIITRDGRNVRVVCWDARGELCILALLAGKSRDDVGAYPNNGRIFREGESPADLMLEIPEYMRFKDGGITTLGWKIGDDRFCEGQNIAHDCDEDCFAVEFYKGFLSGWDACIKHLGEIPWDEAMNEICNHITNNSSKQEVKNAEDNV